MGIILREGVWIGTACALSVFVFVCWWFRIIGAKKIKNTAEIVDENNAQVEDGGDTSRNQTLEPKHKVFLSHSGTQKDFVEQLCVDLERRDIFPFFDKWRDSLPIGCEFPKVIFEAIEQCEVGVVILSEEFFTRSKWPMLELVEMVKHPKLVIMPVYHSISREAVRDRKVYGRWRKKWCKWAKEDKRIKVEEWKKALKRLGPLNGLLPGGDGEVGFRKRIVEAVCMQVPPLSRWRVSHIQGRHRLEEVIFNNINQAAKSKPFGIVGLYGVGGIGKTTFCHVLCNGYHREMRGRVFHVELGSTNDEELLLSVLKRLCDKDHTYLTGLNKSEREELLQTEIRRNPIFLAIDNMGEDTKSIEKAKLLLKGGFHEGSRVLITTRSLDVLKNAHLGIYRRNMFEMPDLNEGEAKLVLLRRATQDEEASQVDNDVIQKCLKQCYFQKGDKKSYHYHPLALKILGIQLGCKKYNRDIWIEMLSKVNRKDIFSVLRISYDALEKEDQMLFMDVAIFLPLARISFGLDASITMTSIDWLSIFHEDVENKLELLKKWSLIEDFGDGSLGSIGIHDLWREFAIMETRAGEFVSRRWAHVKGGLLIEGDPLGNCWPNMKRMCLSNINKEMDVNFDHYSKIEMLRLQFETLSRTMVLNLKNLKSLEIFWCGEGYLEVCGLSEMKNLKFLHLGGVRIQNIDDIGSLAKLCTLIIANSQCPSFPNVGGLPCLQEVQFVKKKTLTTISDLSLSSIKLRVLNLEGSDHVQCPDFRVDKLVVLENLIINECTNIRTLPGLGGAITLNELSARGCKEIIELPNLQNLTQLKHLLIDGCIKIKSIPGLENLVALKEFSARGCHEIVELPNLENLTQLKRLHIDGCIKIKFVQGLHKLVTLEAFDAHGCHEIVEFPNLQKLTQLKMLCVESCTKIKSLPGLDYLVALVYFLARGCHEIERLPNLNKLTQLTHLCIDGCNKIKSIPGLENLVALEEFSARGCHEIVELPNLDKLTQLKRLHIDGCIKIKFVQGLHKLVTLEAFDAHGCHEIVEFPNLQKLTQLKMLCVKNCTKIKSLPGLDYLVALEDFLACGCHEIDELPNLGKLIQLKRLVIDECNKIKFVAGLEKLVVLERFLARGCHEIVEFPNLEKLTQLRILCIENCNKIKSLPGLDYLVALVYFLACGCHEIEGLPNLNKLTQLKHLCIDGCNKIKTIPGLENLIALEEFSTRGCHEIVELPNLEKLIQLKRLVIYGCNKIKFLQGLDKLVALEAFVAHDCHELVELPNLQKLTQLKLLCVDYCIKIKSLPGLDYLVSLEDFLARGCHEIEELPNLDKLTQLKRVNIDGCNKIKSIPGLEKLVALERFSARGCHEIVELPNLEKLIQLKRLVIDGCNKIKSLPGLNYLVALETFSADGCYEIVELPNLEMLIQLKRLDIDGCNKIKFLQGLDKLVALEAFVAHDCHEIVELPNLQKLTQLKLLCVEYCNKIKSLPGLDYLVALEDFLACGCHEIEELSNLDKLTQLKRLNIDGCNKIKSIPGLEKLVALERFSARGCHEIVELPNLEKRSV